jgi:hypothetical protein
MPPLTIFDDLIESGECREKSSLPETRFRLNPLRRIGGQIKIRQSLDIE